MKGRFCSNKTTNENREKLVDFANNFRLRIANTFYTKRKSKKWTWQSLDKSVFNELDFFLINDMSMVEDVCLQKKLNFPSHHRLI